MDVKIKLLIKLIVNCFLSVFVFQVIYRDKTGKRRDLLDEKRQEELAEAKKEIVNAKYKEWNKG